MVKDLLSTLKFIFTHPASGKNKWAAFKRFTGWQIQSRTFQRPVVYPFVEQSKLIVQGGMTGATGNIYTGLHEFEDMMFLLHLLRPGDLFVDVGANIGSYTVLASAVVGANSVSFEPVPATYLHLKHNVAINDVEPLVELHNAGVGSEEGILHFTSGLDTMNHVASDPSSAGNIRVDIVTLDKILENKNPVLIKMDTEGFEMSVLEGALSTIGQPSLMALIIEINGSCQRYGVNENDIHNYILGKGFSPVSYDPFKRSASVRKTFNPHGNTIYIRNENQTAERLTTARKFSILKQAV